jgi:phosphatidylserine decarboxylase
VPGRVTAEIVRWIPRGLVSRLWGGVARSRRPRFAVEWLKRTYAQTMGIDLTQALEPLESFESLEALFVRRLREGARPIDADAAAVVSPVDGTAGARGIVEAGMLLQAKGRLYGLGDLLGDEEASARFQGGSYATMYLAPPDYHRVHVPLDGQVRQAAVIPGTLFPVFDQAVQHIDRVFSRNERIITYLDTAAAGRLACVMVGAMMVGRMRVSYDEAITTNRWTGRRTRHTRYDPPHALRKGDELGTFELGSTVVLIAEPGRIAWELPEAGQPLRMGQRIGTITPAQPTTAG